MPAALSVRGIVGLPNLDVWLATGAGNIGPLGSWQCQAQRPQRIGRRMRRTAAAAAAASGSLSLAPKPERGCERLRLAPEGLPAGVRGDCPTNRACSPGSFGVASP